MIMIMITDLEVGKGGMRNEKGQGREGEETRRSSKRRLGGTCANETCALSSYSFPYVDHLQAWFPEQSPITLASRIADVPSVGLQYILLPSLILVLSRRLRTS
ncbi:hypothetical protein V6N12_002297 [Hibiscus sabdariffa]|uniref:Uncharacterized protein n=1 Tax=Hibiscus sabdariffa TaxID=183260 RepID=A0ABR2B1R8_9ROSI